MPSPRSGLRGPYAKSAQRRRSIVAAAVEVFASRGYTAGSLQEIADRIGMSQTSLLHYFPTKRDLLLAVLERRDYMDEERRVLAQENDFPASIANQARLNERVPKLIELYVVLCGEAVTANHPARAYFTSRYSQGREIYEEQLRELRAEGRLRDGVDIGRAAASIIALWDGIQVQWLLDPATDMAACLADYLDLIIRPAAETGSDGAADAGEQVGASPRRAHRAAP